MKEICAHCASDIEGPVFEKDGYPFCDDVCYELWKEEDSEDE